MWSMGLTCGNDVMLFSAGERGRLCGEELKQGGHVHPINMVSKLVSPGQLPFSLLSFSCNTLSAEIFLGNFRNGKGWGGGGGDKIKEMKSFGVGGNPPLQCKLKLLAKQSQPPT